MPEHVRLQDEAIGGELTAFARRVAGDGVSVSFHEGVAEIRGQVASSTKATALQDLIRWHEGVVRVVSALRVIPGESAAEHVHEMT